MASTELCQGPLVLDIKLPLFLVHLVELVLKLQAQFDLFLVVLAILHVLFFKFESQITLIGFILFKLLSIGVEGIHVIFHRLFIFYILSHLVFVFNFKPPFLFSMLVNDFCNKKLIIGLTAVLEEDVEYLPQRSDDLVVI